MDVQTAGQWLRAERDRRGLSQNEVARAVGANDPSAIYRIETAGVGARPPIPGIVEGYARLFETTPEFIMGLYGYVWDESDSDFTHRQTPDVPGFEQLTIDQRQLIERIVREMVNRRREDG